MNSGYALGYGDKYCHRFSSASTMNCLDDEGDIWVKSTTVCLQQKLVPLLDTDKSDLSCRYIKTSAFDSHPICYTGGGGAVPTDPSICFLIPEDWKCVLGTVDKIDLISPLGIQQEIEIASICVEQLRAAGYCPKDRDSIGQNITDERCEFWSRKLL